MNMIAWMIAAGYLKKSHSQEHISWMIAICFFTTLLSSCALCLAIAIMRGFEIGTHQKMQGIHSQLNITAHGQSLQAENIERVLHEEFPAIVHTSFYTAREGLVSNPLLDEATPKAVFLIGVDPATHQLTSSLASTIVEGPGSLKQTIANSTVLIGKRLAQELEITVGNEIECMVGSSEQSSLQKFTFEKEPITIGGIFETGINEYDSHAIFCSFAFLKTMFLEIGVEQINCSLKNGTDETALKNDLQKRLHLNILSWKDLYPALVSALDLEKKVGFLIFALILFIACLNNASLLIMYINHKKRNIALLRSIGCPLKTVQSIFLLFVILITATATITGILLASLISFFINTYQLFPLPDAYYVTHLTLFFDWSVAAVVLFVSLFITLLISYVTTRLIRKEEIAHTLRFE
jgi:lipoprotein-releasing system permease protein